jgi:hypothetical protein
MPRGGHSTQRIRALLPGETAEEYKKWRIAQYLASPHGKAQKYKESRKWRAANRDKVLFLYKKYDLKRYYNMTIESWNILFEAQGRCCAVCKSPYPGRKNGQWSTDHSRKTGKVRGIVCNGCNLALGHVKDDPDRLRMLIQYLEEQETSDAKS